MNGASVVLRALLAIALMVASVSMAVPCADDLGVATGTGPERCVGAPTDAAPDETPNVCPCACHMAADVNAGAPDAPGAPVEEIAAGARLAELAPQTSPITHPPQG